jgi:EamA domain-containing membrane protein RarD
MLRIPLFRPPFAYFGHLLLAKHGMLRIPLSLEALFSYFGPFLLFLIDVDSL